MRRLALLLLPALLVLPVGAHPAAAQDTGGGGDNVAVAVNTRDGSSVFRLAFSIRQVMDGTVDQTNAAVAYSSCESCQTVAIALQVVLVYGDAQVVQPTNLALAVNQDCVSCLSAALATQLVLGSDGSLPLSGPVWGELGQLRARFQRLRTEEFASLEELQAEVDAFTGDLERILREAIAAQEAAGEVAPEGADATSTTTTTSTTSAGDATSTTATTVAGDGGTTTTEAPTTTAPTATTTTTSAVSTTTETSTTTAP